MHPFTNTSGLYEADDYKWEYDMQVHDHIANTGIVVYIVFVALMGIVLINLLVARMAGTHDRIDAQAKAEWGFTQVRALQL